jgi:hypothetical protein
MRNAYAIPISVQLFSPASSVQETFQRLASRFNIQTQPVRPGRPTYKATKPPPIPVPVVAAPTYGQLIQDSIAFDSRALKETTERYGLSLQDLENLPMAVQPTAVKTKLLPYQLQGLKWLLNMEHPKLPDNHEVRQFWKRHGSNWLNIATN